MTLYGIIDVIRTSKKYSKSNFSYEYDNIFYNIDNFNYKINCYTENGKCCFTYERYSLNLMTIDVKFKNRYDLTEKKILSSFGKIIKYIKKVHKILLQTTEIKNKIIPILSSYLKDSYDIEMSNVDTDNISLAIKLPSKTIRIRNKYRTVGFDVKVDNLDNIEYTINFIVKYNNTQYRLELKYVTSENKLALTNTSESYLNFSNDVTRIIRSEKIRRLNFLNTEEYVG